MLTPYFLFPHIPPALCSGSNVFLHRKFTVGAFIKELISILHNAYISKKLVLFVGAGADFTSGIPLWENAIEKFCQHLNIPSNGADPLKIPQIYHNSLQREFGAEPCKYR